MTYCACWFSLSFLSFPLIYLLRGVGNKGRDDLACFAEREDEGIFGFVLCGFKIMMRMCCVL